MPTLVKCTPMWELFPAVRHRRKAAEKWKRRKVKKRRKKRRRRASGRRRNTSNTPLCYTPCPTRAWPVWTSLCPFLQRPGRCPAHQPPVGLHLWPHRPTTAGNPSITQRCCGRRQMFQTPIAVWESRQTWPKRPPRRTCTSRWIPSMKALALGEASQENRKQQRLQMTRRKST